MTARSASRPVHVVVGFVLPLVVACSVAPAAGPAPATVAGAAVVPGASHPAPLPPGVNETGVVDPVRLADAHATILGTVSYTVTATRVERFANGTLRTRVETTGRHGVGQQFLYTTSVEETADRYYAGPAGTWEVWSNGSLTAGAFTDASGTSYQLRGRTDPSLDRRDDLLVLASVLETSVTNRSASNGTTGHRIVATGVRHPADLARAYGVDAVRDVSFSAVVTPEGLVREYRLAFDASRGNATIRVLETTRFSAVGSTRVVRPEWLSGALIRENATRA